MNFFRRLLCCVSKRKHRRVHPSGSPDKCCRQTGPGKRGVVGHHNQENTEKHLHFAHKDVQCGADLERQTAQTQRELDRAAWLPHDHKGTAKGIDQEEITSKIKRNLDELAALTQHDLDKTAVRIRAELNVLAAWVQKDLNGRAAWIQTEVNKVAAGFQKDLNETAARIQLEIEKLESHLQHGVRLFVDRAQHGLEENSIQVQSGHQDLTAQHQLSLEKQPEQIKPELDKEHEQAQHKLRSGPSIQTKIKRTINIVLYDQDTPADMALEETSIQSQEKAALLQSGLATQLTTPHCEPSENSRFHSGMSLENFTLHKVLGRGSFGKVMLAELKESSGKFFAIKALKKSNILANNHMKYLLAEKQVLMLTVDCPFLAHLYFTFQTTDNLFFVMEYINGGDMSFHIQEKGCFDLISTQFYAAEITCGLQFLHRNGVIYRDLKMENVMLDRDGHIKIVDFGICKGNMFGDKRTKTYCGTDWYMAPEIFQRDPYFSPVDWWALGVLVYEMLTGVFPFPGDDEDEICNSVCTDIPQYEYWMTQETKDILEKLLEKDPSCRLGTFGNIREHPFFESIDWPRLERREMEPPFKPDLLSNSDCSYFDTEFLNETPRISRGDYSYIGPIDQSVFADF